MTERLLLLRQQISDSHHSDHTQSKRPHLKCQKWRLQGEYCDERVSANVMRTHLHEDARAQEVSHFLQDLFLKNVPRHRALQIEDERITKPAGVQKQEAVGPAVPFRSSLRWERWRALLCTCGPAAQHRLCYTPAGQSSQPDRCSCSGSEAGSEVLGFAWKSEYYRCRCTSGCSD